MTSADYGWSTMDRPLAAPNDYFEATIAADGDTNYHVWARLRAGGNSKWNDSLWLQFGDAIDQNGAAIYRIGSADALLVNLENCNGCGASGWGWQDRGWWTGQSRSYGLPRAARTRFESRPGKTACRSIRSCSAQRTTFGAPQAWR